MSFLACFTFGRPLYEARLMGRVMVVTEPLAERIDLQGGIRRLFQRVGPPEFRAGQSVKDFHRMDSVAVPFFSGIAQSFNHIECRVWRSSGVVSSAIEGLDFSDRLKRIRGKQITNPKNSKRR